MIRKSLSILLCLMMVVSMFPTGVLAQDVQQNLPISEGMETTASVARIQSTVQSGTVSLTQDRVSGNYAVKVAGQDEPGKDYVSYILANSTGFAVYDYSQIKLWVKPGAGAQWIKFFTGTDTLIKNDKNADGVFSVGQDLISGKWNEVTLDLARTSNPNLSVTDNLMVQTNEFSTWFYDESKSIYSPVTNIDASLMVNSATRQVNGEVQFIPNPTSATVLTNSYNVTPAILTSQNQNVLTDGKISNIFIDSSYTATSGSSALPVTSLLLSGTSPTEVAVSGNGNRIFYLNSSVSNKLYMIDLLTGENRKISDSTPITKIEPNYDGTKVAYQVDNGSNIDYLYFYDDISKTTKTYFSETQYSGHDVLEFETQNDGTVYYYASTSSKWLAKRTPTDTGTTILSGVSSLQHFTVSRDGEKLFYSTWNGTYGSLYSLIRTPAGWKSEELYKNTFNCSKMWANSDGSIVYYQGSNNEFYSFEVYSKASRKLNITRNSNTTIFKVTDNNNLIIQDVNYKYQVYDIDKDTLKDIRPSDAKTPTSYSDTYFDVDNTGDKMAYTSTSGLSTYYFNGVERPERYLLSFDGKNSWLTYKGGVWTTVKTGASPVTTDFDTYGMTIDEINALTPADFEPLYADGRQVMHFDVAVYFASVDPYITPSLKSIKVTMNGGGEYGEAPLEKALYTSKQQSFDTTNWRKIRRIYPIEIQPKEAEMYYFIIKDGAYKSYKNNQWIDVNSTILTNVEGNWIDSVNGQGITQVGMTAAELRGIPEFELNKLLPASDITVAYAMKVNDLSTEGYSSLITIDSVDNLFDSATLTLKVKYIDGTFDDYPNLTKDQVEDFMQWVSERQNNRGPVFYCIKTIANGVEVNDFINYYTIKSVSVNDSVP